MSVKAILTEQQKSYTKAEEDTLLATKYDKDYIDTYMAPLDTPTFIGTPKAPTAAAGTNTTQIATTAFVHEGLQRKSNPNLLRNWYFVGGGTGRGVFPVNSRGQTSYSAVGITYTIDGWYLRNTSAGISLTSTGLNMLKQTVNYCDLGQQLSQGTLDVLVGKVVTISWFDGTTCDYVTYTWNGTNTPLVYSKDGFNIYSGYNAPNPYNVLFQITATQKTLQAVKLELGGQQTLAHQENGTWVLNEVPDYEYELYRCVTSTADSTDTYANKSLATQQQLAPIEWGATASVRHEEGSYFCWNGLLYRTTVAIAANGPITPGTNCELANVANAIDPIAKVLFAQATDIHTDTTVTLNDSSYNYKFLVLALSGDSGNSSSNRGSLTIPIATFSGGMHYPVYVGTTGGVIRLGLLSGESNKLRIISTSISSIYLQAVYGIR